MRITRNGLLLAALIFVMAFVALAAMILAANELLSDGGLITLELAIVAAGLALWKLLDRQRRIEAAEDNARNAYARRQQLNVAPEPCQLCYAMAARVRCVEHKLDICVGCCNYHDTGARCTLYLLQSGYQVSKARY